MANEVLKQIFQEMHQKIVGMNADPVMDMLLSENIIGADDCSRLHQLFPVSRDRCRELLLLLHNLSHPQAFIYLRLALIELDAYSFIIDEVDKKLPSLTSQLQQLHLNDCIDGKLLLNLLWLHRGNY